jgi:GT2 family glycosyltransferase
MTAIRSTPLDVSIVIFRSDPEALRRTLASLTRQTTPPHQIRVLVNDVEPETAASVRDLVGTYDPNIEVQHAGSNLGFAGGHNRLLQAAFVGGAESCLVLNPDVELEADALERLTAAAAQAPDALLSGVLVLGDRTTLTRTEPSLVDSRGTIWTTTCRHLDENHGEPLQVEWLTGSLRRTAAITGALCLVPRAAWKRIVDLTGEFYDEDFFAYREDAELGLRASYLNIPSIVVQAVVGTHYRGSPGVSRQDSVVNWLSVRNRFLLAFKYGHRRPGRLPHRFARDVLTLVGVLLTEPSSVTALVDAWRLRSRMRTKGNQLMQCAGRVAKNERAQYA